MSESVSIYFTSDGKEWADYLEGTFSSKKYEMTAVLSDFSEPADSTDAKLNILLITPALLELDDTDIKCHFSSTTSIAVLAGVSDEDWKLASKIIQLDRRLDLYVYELGENEESVKNLVTLIVSLYESIGRQYPRFSESDTESLQSGTDEEIRKPSLENSSVNSTCVSSATETDDNKEYQFLPCNRPVHAVSFVFRKADRVYILLEAANHGNVEVKFPARDSSVQAARVADNATLYSFQHHRTEEETFTVMLDGIEIGYGEVEEFARPNSYTFDGRCSFRSSASSSGVSSSRESGWSYDDPCTRQPPPAPHRQRSTGSNYVEMSRTPPRISGISESSYASQSESIYDVVSEATTEPASRLELLNRLLADVTDPIGILCHSLGVENDVMQLDDKLASLVQSTNVLKQLHYQPDISSMSETSDALWPTLLHFGAQFDLRKFCCLLVKNPMTQVAMVKKNKNGCVPYEIAKMNGHTHLADYLKQASEDFLSGKSDSTSSSSPRTESSKTPPAVFPKPKPTVYPRTPPPVHTRTPSARSFSSEEEGTPKGILKFRKRPSEDSLRSDEEVLFDTTGDDFTRQGSLSSIGSHGVTFSPNRKYSDEEKTPVPSFDRNPFDDDTTYGDRNGKNGASARTVPISIPNVRVDNSFVEEEREMHQKDIRKFLGVDVSYKLPSSVPNESHMHHAEKKHHHGLLSNLFPKKKDSSKFYDQRSDDDGRHKHGKSHSGEKTKVYKHKKGHYERRDSSPDEREEYRSRLQTYPLPGQIMRRPNVKKLKAKHAEREQENNLSSSIPDLAGGSNDSPEKPDKTPSRGSQSLKDKTDYRREKKNHTDNNDHHKSKIDWMIKHATRRKSTRVKHAQEDQHTSAPALPPRPTHMKNIPGKF